jgi:acetoin utilization deacetylase AcuC-like enzyme
MKAFLDSRQSEHDPKYFMRSGAIAPNPEQPKRVDILSAGAKDAGCAFVEPTDMGIGHIARIHSPQYLTFLENIHERWTRIPGGGEEVVPNIHPRAREDGYPRSAVGQAGYHQADTACPIAEHTWKSAYWSAQSALNGADFIAKGGPNAYALSRPPGHHAYADQAGGFCF